MAEQGGCKEPLSAKSGSRQEVPTTRERHVTLRGIQGNTADVGGSTCIVPRLERPCFGMTFGFCVPFKQLQQWVILLFISTSGTLPLTMCTKNGGVIYFTSGMLHFSLHVRCVVRSRHSCKTAHLALSRSWDASRATEPTCMTSSVTEPCFGQCNLKRVMETVVSY